VTELVEFLRARLAEDQASTWAMHDVAHCDALLYEEDMADAARRDPDCDCGRPARALRAVEAKRQLVDGVMAWPHQLLYGGYDENTGPYPCTREGVECDPVFCGVGEKQRQVLGALAAEFAGHPDYRSEWGVE